MSQSRLLAQRFAIDLNGFALGMWEAAHLASKGKEVESNYLLDRLRTRLQTFRQRPFLGDSLRVYYNFDFRPEKYAKILENLEKGFSAEAVSDIEQFVKLTESCLHETSGTKTDFKKPL